MCPRTLEGLGHRLCPRFSVGHLVPRASVARCPTGDRRPSEIHQAAETKADFEVRVGRERSGGTPGNRLDFSDGHSGGTLVSTGRFIHFHSTGAGGRGAQGAIGRAPTWAAPPGDRRSTTPRRAGIAPHGRSRSNRTSGGPEHPFVRRRPTQSPFLRRGGASAADDRQRQRFVRSPLPSPPAPAFSFNALTDGTYLERRSNDRTLDRLYFTPRIPQLVRCVAASFASEGTNGRGPARVKARTGPSTPRVKARWARVKARIGPSARG